MKPCRKCLSNELGDTAFFEHMREYIKAIPQEQKTSADEYERRLKICKGCENLVSGMCVLCGCYVEVRAAKAAQRCVMSADAW
jgi:hypothetical protein